MNGDDGDDTMDGGTEGDVLCGGSQVTMDELSDGDGTAEGATHDKLWGADSGDEVECLDSSTQVDAVSTPVGICAATALDSEPIECP